MEGISIVTFGLIGTRQVNIVESLFQVVVWEEEEKEGRTIMEGRRGMMVEQQQRQME
jgi:hypothetical protein